MTSYWISIIIAALAVALTSFAYSKRISKEKQTCENLYLDVLFYI